jgi:hypothetical protein
MLSLLKSQRSSETFNGISCQPVRGSHPFQVVYRLFVSHDETTKWTSIVAYIRLANRERRRIQFCRIVEVNHSTSDIASSTRSTSKESRRLTPSAHPYRAILNNSLRPRPNTFHHAPFLSGTRLIGSFWRPTRVSIPFHSDTFEVCRLKAAQTLNNFDKRCCH